MFSVYLASYRTLPTHTISPSLSLPFPHTHTHSLSLSLLVFICPDYFVFFLPFFNQQDNWTEQYSEQPVYMPDTFFCGDHRQMFPLPPERTQICLQSAIVPLASAQNALIPFSSSLSLICAGSFTSTATGLSPPQSLGCADLHGSTAQVPVDPSYFHIVPTRDPNANSVIAAAVVAQAAAGRPNANTPVPPVLLLSPQSHHPQSLISPPLSIRL